MTDAEKLLEAYCEAKGIAKSKRAAFHASVSRVAARLTALPLPERAPERFDERQVVPELGRQEKIGEFLIRVWGKYMIPGVGPLTRNALRKFDDSAEAGIKNWIAYYKTFPEGIYLPTLSEAIDESIEGEDPRDLMRRAVAAYRRAGLTK